MQRLLHSPEVPFVVLRMLLILAATILIARIWAKVSKKKNHEKLYYRLLFNLTNAAIYVAGTIFMLSQVIDFEGGMPTLLAGSGIAALAISLGAQESLGNFINGIVISISKPFEVGDRIRLVNGNITGWIEDITMRHTIVRTFMNSRVIIPNSVINKDMIENSNFQEARAAGFIDVIITYDSDLDAAMEILARVIAEHPNFVDPRPPDDTESPMVTVFVRGLTIYGVELRASAWTCSIANSFITCSDIRHNLKIEYDAAGIKFAVAQIAAEPPPTF